MKFNPKTHAPLNIAITKDCQRELQRLARTLGISQRAVVELAVRAYAVQQERTDAR